MFRAVVAVVALSLLGSPIAAQTSARPSIDRAPPGIGDPVRGASGEVLGRIESITRDSSGRPVQAVVRTRGIAGVRAQSRAVPIASLRPEGSGWVLPLRRSEFNLLPAVRP